MEIMGYYRFSKEIKIMKKHLITLGLTLGICGLLFGATIYPIEVGIPLVISLAFTAIYITIWILVDSFNKK